MMNANYNKNIDGQIYLDFFEFFNTFLKELARYDHNLYEFYFGSTFNNNYSINFQFINDLMSKIAKPNQNSNEYQIYTKLAYFKDELIKKLNFLPNQFLNPQLMNTLKTNKKEVQITYGLLQCPLTQKCTSCFKDFVDTGKELDDPSPVQLKWCKHIFCRGCLKRYIIRSTNNLIFLTRKDTANNNKRVLKCLSRECEFILFLEDYYNIFGDELFSVIKNNYFMRVNQPSSNKVQKSFCLSCGTDKLQGCYFCPSSNQNMNNADVHCLCLECSELYYMKCRKVNNDRTILGNLPCPLPFCNTNIISIKENLIQNKKSKIKNISIIKPDLIRINKTSQEVKSTFIQPKPSFKKLICICGVEDNNLPFSHDYICSLNHHMHLECIIGYLSANIDSKHEKTFKQIITCPFMEGGIHYLNMEYIMSILQHLNEDKLNAKILKLQMEDQEMFECLNLSCLGLNFIFDKNSDIVTCPQCCSSYCVKCMKFAHGIISCEGGNREELLANGFMPCPYCYELFAKDDKCNHVKCSKCKNDFCFRCSAKRSPIMEHGNHYHRSNCTDYSKYDGEDPFKDKCDCCSILKSKTGNATICPRPLDFENGDIPQAEIEFNQFFQD